MASNPRDHIVDALLYTFIPRSAGAATHETDGSLRRRLLYVTGDPGVLGMSPASLDALAANLDLRRRTREELDMETRTQLRWMERVIADNIRNALMQYPGAIYDWRDP